MVALYFAYGLAFFGAGLLLGFQARLPISALTRRQLACLAAFAVLHGLFEWTKMEQLAASSPSFAWPPVQLALLALSFTFLMQFGFEVLIALAHVPVWTRAVPTVLLLIASVTGLTLVDGHVANAEAMARYVLGFPSASLAALALLAVDRKQRNLDHVHRGRLLFALAAGALVVYGIVAGLVVPRATFFPASWLNGEAFHEAFRLRIEVVRAVCAVIIAFTLTEVFVVETAREHAEWERQREEFISVVAHDLRSPIGAIAAGAAMLEELIKRGDGLDADRALRVIRHMKSSGNSLDRMVSDLLDASRIEAHRLTIEAETLDLRSFTAAVVSRASAATTGHPIRTVLPESLPKVAADPARIEQVLTNLLSNAAKYSAPESEILLEVFARELEVEVAVTNVGEGLAPEHAANVFTRFYRMEAHRSRVPGLGLGLYIAKGLVEAHGGRMWVDSEPGKSTTFAFTLPMSPLPSRVPTARSSFSASRRDSRSET